MYWKGPKQRWAAAEALNAKRVEVAEALLKVRYIDVNAKDARGRTGLHIAALADSNGELLDDLTNRKDTILSALDSTGHGVFHYAAFRGAAKNMRSLLSHDKVRKTLNDEDMKSVLQWAVTCRPTKHGFRSRDCPQDRHLVCSMCLIFNCSLQFVYYD